MTNDALERLSRYSSVPPAMPERPIDGATFDEKLAYLVQLSASACDALIEERQYRHDLLIVLRELQCELSRLKGGT